MKKGFTLIELLSVIIILAIILVIAVPRILKIIESSKINAYISSEKAALKSAELYVSKNINELPVNIGDTSEILLSDLIDNGYIKEVKSPLKTGENCSGYVLVTKLGDNNYDYTSHLNCVVDIDNSVDDKLVAYYKFNEFQEPTENFYTDPLMISGKLNITSTAGTYSQSYHELIDNPYGTYTTAIEYLAAGGTGDLHHYGVTKSVNLAYEGAVTYSCYVKAPIGKSIGIRINRNISGVTVWTNSMVNYIATGDWQLISATIAQNSSGITTGFNLRVGFNNVNVSIGDKMYIATNQLEKKSYATPFVVGIREAIVKDYSINNNHITLDLNTTPTWQENAYNFNGNNTYMTLPNNLITNANIRTNGLTYSLWIKTSNPSLQRIIGLQISVGYSEYSSGGIGISSTKNPQMIAYSDASPSAYLSAQGTSVLESNKWYHIVGTFDPTNNQLKVYLNGKIDGPAVTVGVFSRLADNNSNRIGNRDNPTPLPYSGLIKDVKIYNRALTENEINYMYETEK